MPSQLDRSCHFGGKIISFRQEGEDTVVTQMLRTQYICLVGGVAKVNVATVQPPLTHISKMCRRFCHPVVKMMAGIDVQL